MSEPELQPAAPKQSRLAGFLLSTLGAIVVALGGLVVAFAPGLVTLGDQFGTSTLLKRGVFGLLFGVIGALIAFAGRVVWIRGRRHLTPLISERAARDCPAPVLYLRSFADDADRAVPASERPFVRGRTGEEELLKVFAGVGPAIAIGRPREPLPQLGAARLYLDEANWQPTVTDLMTKAALVLIRVGTTHGVSWELRKAVDVVAPIRLLLLVPFGREEYEQYRQETVPHLPGLLTDPPGEEGPTRGPVVQGLHGLVWFDPDWTSRYVPIPPMAKTRPLADALRQTVQPVLARLDRASWPAPSAARPVVPPGWYPDPSRRYEYRYWDGIAWSAHVATAGRQEHDEP